MKILLCDDQTERRDEFVGAIRSGGQLEPNVLLGSDLTEELKSLFEYVKGCLNDPRNCKPDKKFVFDDMDIVILDNNLAHLEVAGARLTAESIAGYIRAFTKARYVISLNKNPDVDFDLRYLVGDYSTRADLALNTPHLKNRALWSGKPEEAEEGFRPWYWPNLSEVASRRQKQIDFVMERLDALVLDALGFDSEAIEFLSLHARGALYPDADESIPFDKMTFSHVFLGRDRSLPSKYEREGIVKTAKDNVALRQIIARVVAADIDLWFRRDVVGPQESLVDLPHLLARFPFLLGERAKNIAEWNKCISANAPPYGLEKTIYEEHLAKREFKREFDFWLPARPCFWWPKLKTDEKLNEYFFNAKEGEWADAVFCEDRALFLEREPKNDGTPPVEFPAEFEGSWGRRYVSGIKGFRYAPRSRLAV